MEPYGEEPRREEAKASTPRPEEKRKRFRILKLEERIAPKYHVKGTQDSDASVGGLSIE